MPHAAADRYLQRAVEIPIEQGVVNGDLREPSETRGLIIFAHGSGSSRFSTRNRQVAESLERRGFATLLLDLLTAREDALDQRAGEYRFDIQRLGTRVIAAVEWAANRPGLRDLPIGCFGASTGAAAALIAAAARPDRITAVVSRGGRPDLAHTALPGVTSPTLLIVGGDDVSVIDMNREAMRQMTSAHVDLQIVPGATYLFEEPETLEHVERLAGEWFGRYLVVTRGERGNSSHGGNRYA